MLTWNDYFVILIFRSTGKIFRIGQRAEHALPYLV